MFIALLLAGSAGAQVSDPVPGNAPIGDIAVELEVVVELPDTGAGSKPWARPMTVVGDGSGRIFVADQNGFVFQLHAAGTYSVFLDVEAATDLLANQSQQGLSSIAFHPDYHSVGSPGFGKFYTSSAQTIASGTPDFPVPSGAPESHHGAIHEWDVSGDPDAIDANSAREILRVGQPYRDHNVAQIAFNTHVGPAHPDYGLLFISFGDGGNVSSPRPSVDPQLMGQALDHPLGSILRIDPLEDTVGGNPYSVPTSNPFATDGDPTTLAEIWAYGLRNPHRFSWDGGGHGRMLISDIGQANVEEINLGAVGANYGWSEREGTYLVVHDNEDDVFPLPGNEASLEYTYPVIQYDHDEDDRAISGGYVFRSALASSLEGQYIFGDLRSGRVFYAPVSALDGSGQVGFEVLRLIDGSDGQEKSLLEMIGGGTPAPRADLRFGTDDAGNIYLCTKRDGVVRRLNATFDPVGVPGLGPRALTLLAVALALISIRRPISSLSAPRRCRIRRPTPSIHRGTRKCERS